MTRHGFQTTFDLSSMDRPHKEATLRDTEAKLVYKGRTFKISAEHEDDEQGYCVVVAEYTDGGAFVGMWDNEDCGYAHPRNAIAAGATTALFMVDSKQERN